MPISIKLFEELDAGLKAGVSLSQMLNLEQFRQSLGDFDREESKYAFPDSFGYDCPQSLFELLALPTTLDLVWRKDNAAGEFHLVNPLIGVERHPDPSYPDIGGVSVPDLCILDQVTDIAGPWFVLFDPIKVESDGLFLFDGRELGSLTLSPEKYVELCGLGAGFDSWAFLFADLPIASDRRRAIQTSFEAVKQLFPDRNLEIFQTKISSLAE